jgi:hypothetical protein
VAARFRTGEEVVLDEVWGRRAALERAGYWRGIIDAQKEKEERPRDA